MELFSELYGCYYSVVANILERSHQEEGLTEEDIRAIVAEDAFSESGLHLLPRLLEGEWDLLRKQEGRYCSKLCHREAGLPLTRLQKAWLKALLQDRRIRLFLEESELRALSEQLADVVPLFSPSDFHVFDAATDGDDFGDPSYIRRFRLLRKAMGENKVLRADYQSAKGGRIQVHILPRQILYSPKDDKFRVEGLQAKRGGQWGHVLLNLARIQALAPSDRIVQDRTEDPAAEQEGRRALTLAIFQERNALERCMLQFASYQKETSYDEEGDRYLCHIRYDAKEESELLIRILSFGPVAEVLEPQSFRRQIARRIRSQLERQQ